MSVAPQDIATMTPPRSSQSASPPSGKEKTKHNRSRGGCARCRSRRQKCDEMKPECSRCQETGIGKCVYEVNLQWGGRNFQSYARNENIKKLETEPGTFVYVASAQKRIGLVKEKDGERLTRSLSPLDAVAPNAQLLLHHFATSASRITSCHNQIQSSFCELLLPMAMSYPPLLSALTALSAIHRHSLITPSLRRLPYNDQQPKEIISLKASSITQLRSELLVPNVNAGMRNAVLATALTLCMCEIHSGADQPRSWRLHLQGAEAILSSATKTNSGNPKGQEGLLERWYTSIEALAAISSKGLKAGDLPPTHSSSLDEVDIEEKKDVYLDDYFGFSTELVPLFKEIGALAWEWRATMDNERVLLSQDDVQAEAQLLESRILDMISREPPPFYPGVKESLSDEVVHEFWMCNEAYLYSALLHIYRRIMQLGREDEGVQRAVERILECVERIVPREGLSPYIVLTMPLFTAGREALGSDRETVRRKMKELSIKLGLRNIWRGLEFLEAGWASGDEAQDQDNCDFIPY